MDGESNLSTAAASSDGAVRSWFGRDGCGRRSEHRVQHLPHIDMWNLVGLLRIRSDAGEPRLEHVRVLSHPRAVRCD
jgi:hypothetical protein